MGLARIKNWTDEILTASDLNAEFNNLLNNALSLISPLTGALDCDGKELILDGDADTSITADTDDQIDFRIGGGDDFRMTANTLTALAGSSIVQTDGILFIGDTANSNMTIGLTINLGGNSNQAFCLKSSDVATGLTAATLGGNVETDDFFNIRKAAGAEGGALIQITGESTQAAPLLIESYAGAPSTMATALSLGAMNFFVAQHNGSNGITDMAANSIGFAWGEITSASVRTTRMALEVDTGELFLGIGGVSPTDMDDMNDPELVRTMMLVNNLGHKGIIESKWDEFIIYNRQTLIDVGILTEGDSPDVLLSVQQLFRLHNGAIWQIYTQHMQLQEQYDQLEHKVLALGGPA